MIGLRWSRRGYRRSMTGRRRGWINWCMTGRLCSYVPYPLLPLYIMLTEAWRVVTDSSTEGTPGPSIESRRMREAVRGEFMVSLRTTRRSITNRQSVHGRR